MFFLTLPSFAERAEKFSREAGSDGVHHPVHRGDVDGLRTEPAPVHG